jgi:hypothetical protein
MNRTVRNRKMVIIGVVLALFALLFASMPLNVSAELESTVPETPVVKGPPGLTIGFWKTNIGKCIGEQNGKPQVPCDKIKIYLKGINNPHFADLTLEEAWEMLSIKDASSTYDKGMAHILALILTHAYYKYDNNDIIYLPDIAPVDDPELPYKGPMWYGIELIKKIFFHPELYYGQAVGLALADALNNIGDDGYMVVEPI